MDATSGVPQGGLMSPTLFGLTVRFMNRYVEHSALHQFADDTLLAKAIETAEDLVRLQSDVDGICAYSKSTEAELHPKKSLGLDISIRNNFEFHGDVIVNSVESAKYLGMVHGSHL